MKCFSCTLLTELHFNEVSAKLTDCPVDKSAPYTCSVLLSYLTPTQEEAYNHRIPKNDDNQAANGEV